MPTKLKYGYYRFVPGHERFPHGLYEQVASHVSDDQIICEVGCFMGRSTAFMAELLQVYTKSPKFYAIDMFGSYLDDGDVEHLTGTMPWGEPVQDWAKRIGGAHRLIDHFDFYMENCPANGKITDRVQFPPWHSSEEFDDKSVYFVMLNASRDPAMIQKQLEKWLPKIQRDGIIGVYGTDTREIYVTVSDFCDKNNLEMFREDANGASLTYKK